MRRMIAIASAVACLFTTLLPATVLATQAHVLRFTDGLDVSTLDPLFGTSGNIVFLSELTMAHFTRFDTRGAIVPELITEIPTLRNGGVSADGKTITYRLRRGVKWSDGAPFTADDVAYTVSAILNRENNITERTSWDRLAGVTVRDAYTVVFRLKAPYAPFAAAFFGSSTPSCVLPKHILGGLRTINDAPYNALPVGIGPFRYTAFRRGDAVEMEANPNYFGGRPKLAKIVYKIITDDNTIYTQLQTGELDMWATVNGDFVDRVRSLPDMRVVVTPTAYVSAIYFNVTHPIVGEREVRRALRLATDRAALLRKVFHNTGTLAESVVPHVSQDVTALPQVPYDPPAAERVLDAAGWRRGADGVRTKNGVPLIVAIAIPSGYLPSSSAAEILRADWGKVGIGVDVKSYAIGTFFAPAGAGGIVMSGKFDAAMLSLPGDVFADVSNSFGCAYVPPNGFNVMRYCNRDVDAELDAYRQSYDPKRRKALTASFERRIDADAPSLVVYERAFAFAMRAKTTHFDPTPFGPYDNFLDVDVEP